MIEGTRQNRKCYPIYKAAAKMSDQMRESILGFYALTGCDTTLSFSGHGKKTCWKVFWRDAGLLAGVGRNGYLEPIQQFVCNVYDVVQLSSTVNEARFYLFSKAQKSLSLLPPTEDALELHAIRVNYQARICLQACEEKLMIPRTLDTKGWEMVSGTLQSKWTTLPPIPESCLQLVSCNCKTKCKSAKCACSKSNFRCTSACGCNVANCHNPGVN